MMEALKVPRDFLFGSPTKAAAQTLAEDFVEAFGKQDAPLELGASNVLDVSHIYPLVQKERFYLHTRTASGRYTGTLRLPKVCLDTCRVNHWDKERGLSGTTIDVALVPTANPEGLKEISIHLPPDTDIEIEWW